MAANQEKETLKDTAKDTPDPNEEPPTPPPPPAPGADPFEVDPAQSAELEAARASLQTPCPCRGHVPGVNPCRPSFRDMGEGPRFCSKCKKLTGKDRIEASFSREQLPPVEQGESLCDQENIPICIEPSVVLCEDEFEPMPATTPPPPNQPFNKEEFFQPIPDESPKCHTCMYRRSIEKWRPLQGKIYCPRCHSTEVPLLRTKSRKTNTTVYEAMGSRCFTNCWPLCFMPFLFLQPSENYLHCAECFGFLGMYDERSKCIKPNPDYVDNDGCFSLKRTRRRERIKYERAWRDFPPQ